MRPRTAAATERDTGQHARLRTQCSYVATGLFNDAEAADEAIDEIFEEIPAALRHPRHHATLEAWMLAEVVRRARRHARAVVEREERRKRADASLDMLWRRLHRRGELASLLRQLPVAYAEAFTLHYLERAPLSEMMRRTGASAGVITHRIAQASERLRLLTMSPDRPVPEAHP